MAKEKLAKETAVKTESTEKEITFTCKFCGETKPFNDMVLQSRYFPMLTSCCACDKALQNIQLEGIPDGFEKEEEDSGEEPEDKNTEE